MKAENSGEVSDPGHDQRTERELRLLVTLAREIPAAGDFLAAVAVALKHICEATGWAFGEVWTPNQAGTALELQHTSYGHSPELDAFTDFSRQLQFFPGVGIPGRVWMDKRPEWVKDISSTNNPRARIAMAAGLRSVLGVPVVTDDIVSCVLLFFMREARDEVGHLIELASVIAGQLGAVLKQSQTEHELRQARADLEKRVADRTRELAQANQTLQAEITHRMQIQETLNRRVQQQAAVAQIGQLALSGSDLAGLFDETCVLVARTLDVELCKLLELLPDEQALLLRSGVGWKDGLVGCATVSSALNSQAGYTLASAAPIVVEDLRTETRFEGPALLHEHAVVSGVSVIVPGRDRPFGVLGAHTTKRFSFSQDDVHFLEAVANVLSEAIGRKKAEEAIARGSAWLRSLIDTTQDAVLSIDRQGRVVLFNPAAERIFGYTRDEIVGQKVNVLMGEPYRSEHDAYIERYERTGVPQAIGRIRTVTAMRKNGELFPIELSVTKVAENKGVQYAAFIRDISEKTRLQAQLVDSERLAAIGTTAAKIGHEISNPLNGMSLTVQLLESRLSRESRDAQNDMGATLKRLKNEIVRLNHLAGEFRTISRREQYDFQPTRLAALIDDLLTMQKPEFEKQGIQVHSVVPADLPAVNIDVDKMKQALLNLIKNAIEAMPQGGRLTIEARPSAAGVQLEISDTGTGVSPEVDIFEPFMTTKKDGTGLGLVIVRQIIVAHRGNILYRSRLGHGTTFEIRLPPL